MSKFVMELQKLCLDSKVTCSELLMKAYFLAQKLEVREFETFFDNEMNGYTDAELDLPKYRYVPVEYKCQTSLNSWIPVIIKNGLGYDSLLIRPIASSIIELESIYKTENALLELPIPFEIQEKLNKDGRNPQFCQISGFFQKSQLAKVFQGVRKIILDWTIELEKKGILGENYMFSSEDKETAKSISNLHITINGNVSGKNNIGAIQDCVINEEATIDFDAIKSLVELISNNLNNAGFSDNEKQSIINDINDIKIALAQKNSPRLINLLNHIKEITYNVTGNLLASGIIQQISSLLP